MRLFTPLSTLLILLAAVSAGAATPPPATGATVNVLIWEDFLSDRVLRTLRNQQGITVNLTSFSSTAQRDALLAKKRGTIDLVVADSAWVGDFRRRGLLQPVEAARIPSLKHVLTRWQADSNYAVPYLWGHTGIAWRTDKVKQPLRTYADLFALAKAQPGKVSLLDDHHEALRAALYARGAAPFRMTTASEVSAAAKLLDTIRPFVKFIGSELGDDSPMVKGDVVAWQAYNGDVAYLRDNYHLPVAFAIPSPGCMIWQENFMLLKDAPHKDAAYRFLDAIKDPETAARNATDVHYATSNVLAVEHLPAAFRADTIIRPTFDGLDDCYFYEPFDAKTQAAIDAVKTE